MKSITSLFVIASLFAGVPALTGCEKEVAREERVTESGDGYKKQTTSVKEDADGNLRKETETKKVNP